MSKKVGVVHTFLYSVEDIKALFKKYIPEVEMVNIIDDSLLEEALANKGITPQIVRKMCKYALEAEEMGCDCVLSQCSSMGETVNIARRMLRIPFLKIDEPMAAEAVRLGSRVAVIATAISTVEPSSRLVEEMAARVGKDVSVSRCFADGAYDALLKQGDRDKHNEILIKKITEAANEHDVIVLAQGSMYHLMPLLADIKIPVLTSLESGVIQIRKALNL
ncbi:MAG: aspartate/glutamate racemase family protein [Acetanaerobacterium sp.]